MSSKDDTLQKLLDRFKAKVFYSDGTGLIGLRRDRMYNWFKYDSRNRTWYLSGSTLNKGRGVSKHYHSAK